MLTLPTASWAAFKESFGPVYAEADDLLIDASSRGADTPLVTVDDIVTFYLRHTGRPPDVVVVDGKTKRKAVGEEVHRTVETSHLAEIESEPGTVSVVLVEMLMAMLDDPDLTALLVEGEGDLATLLAVLVTPVGPAVVYGQPNEGVVHVVVTGVVKSEMRGLLARFDDDFDAVVAPIDT